MVRITSSNRFMCTLRLSFRSSGVLATSDGTHPTIGAIIPLTGISGILTH